MQGRYLLRGPPGPFDPEYALERKTPKRPQPVPRFFLIDRLDLAILREPRAVHERVARRQRDIGALETLDGIPNRSLRTMAD